MATLKRICQHCGSEMRCSAAAHRENPFCSGCLSERLHLAAEALGPVEVVFEGAYSWFVPTRQWQLAVPGTT